MSSSAGALPGQTARFFGKSNAHKEGQQGLQPLVLNVWALFGGRLYYNGFSPSGDELHVSDGTATGTRPLRSAGGQRLGQVQDLLPFGSWLLALTNGLELWQTDGTEAGTTLVRDLSPLPYSQSRLIRAGSRVFFRAWDPETGWELWAAED